MFNLQPGMGLGFEASKEIALGLGTPFAVIVIVVDIGTQPAGAVFPAIFYEKGIRRDDQEIIELVIIIVESGIFE